MSELKPFDKFMDALVYCDTVKVILTGCGESMFETKPIYEGICALANRRVQPENKPLTLDYVEEAPTADVAQVVRCKDCISSKCISEGEDVYTCTHPQWTRKPCKDTYEEAPLFHGLSGNDFCSYGQRKE
jgi:hypothetical protein